jgi:hypothetical protein
LAGQLLKSPGLIYKMPFGTISSILNGVSEAVAQKKLTQKDILLLQAINPRVS